VPRAGHHVVRVLSAKGAVSSIAWGIAPGIQLSDEPSAESAFQSRMGGSQSQTAPLVDINPIPMIKRDETRNESRFQR
jgi:hypothetical protein